jgi:hypothetical protein
MNRTALAFILAAFALPIACGGGGQDTNPPATPTAPTDTSSAGMPTASATAAPTDTSSAMASAAPPASAAPAATAPSGPPGAGDWATWSHDFKLAYMKSTVMGKEHDLFAAYDAKKYGDMKCKTCHGSGAGDGSFKMPSADLPVLPAPADLPKLAKKSPKMFKFMMEQVEPQTAQLLGETPYDPKTQQGFGCFNCHTHK